MHYIKRIQALFLVLTLLLTGVVLTACGGNATYQVKVMDAQGNPCTSGIVVKFMQDGKQAGMQPVNENGIAQKELPKGSYTVELVFTNEELTGHYDQVQLTSSSTSAEVALVRGVIGEAKTITATSPATGEPKEYSIYQVGAGSTFVSVEPNDRNYFLFTPTEAGTYKFSVDKADLILGYYGAPHFVQTQNVATDTENNSFTISVSASMIGTEAGGTSTFVVGIDGLAEKSDCTLTIERIGDPAHSVSDEPWTEYKTTHTPTPYTLELGVDEKLTYIDIKGKAEDNQIVFSEADGFYHYGTADGPVVLMHLGKGAPYVSLQVVIQGDGAAGGAPIREYFYDENNTFVKKEDYTNILSDYFANMDPDLGVYPLNDDLIYIIKNGCHGWWTESSPDYIFEGCNPEIGWMFALCYVAS